MPTPLATDNQNANLESRAQAVRDIFPQGTPFLSRLKAAKAGNRLHYFQHQKLATPGNNTGRVEGADVSHAAGDMTARTELSNYVQNILMPFEATFDQDATIKPQIGKGPKSEYNKQMALKSIELVRETDATLWNNATPVAPAQASSTAGLLGGVQYWLNGGAGTVGGSNVIDASQYGDGYLTQDMYDDLTAKAYRNGGMPGDTFMGTFNKRRVAKFVQNVTRQISDSGKKLVDAVNTYENIVGVTNIILEPQIEIVWPGFLFQMDMKHWALAYLRTLTKTDEGIKGTKHSGFVDFTLTLEASAPQTSGMITNLRVNSAN